MKEDKKEGGEGKENWYQVAVTIKESDFPYKRHITFYESQIKEAMKNVFNGYSKIANLPNVTRFIMGCKIEFVEGRLGSLEIKTDTMEQAKDCLEFLGFIEKSLQSS